MRHRKKGKVFDRKVGPRNAMMRNMVTSFIIYEKIKTTLAKAKALRPMAEKIITTSKVNNLNNERKLRSELFHKNAVKKALEVLGPRYKERKGGYTRITKLNQREGDGAQMAMIEFV